ncbi:perlustrin-like protein isoform X1 [Haliotis rufescens]|uniref:perlustrin-like protein isoform X1 n=1 Tax=Haliotis rufescens TaxID=6454 RepID=UPI001EB02049|nr:perlustrin-like protein isoform X1 [Haliotis rufescens]
MNVYLVVLAVGVSAALLLVSLPRVEGLSCVHCSYVRVRCKTLPKSCQATRGPCGCCDICAGKVGQTCSFFKPCEKRLICKRTGWSSAWKRSGTCQRPVKG